MTRVPSSHLELAVIQQRNLYYLSIFQSPSILVTWTLPLSASTSMYMSYPMLTIYRSRPFSHLDLKSSNHINTYLDRSLSLIWVIGSPSGHLEHPIDQKSIFGHLETCFSYNTKVSLNIIYYTNNFVVDCNNWLLLKNIARGVLWSIAKINYNAQNQVNQLYHRVLVDCLYSNNRLTLCQTIENFIVDYIIQLISTNQLLGSYQSTTV